MCKMHSKPVRVFPYAKDIYDWDKSETTMEGSV